MAVKIPVHNIGVVIAFEICQEIPTCTRRGLCTMRKMESLYWQTRGKGDVLAGSRLRRFVSSNRMVSNSIAVVGSSFLWAWGFLCYLSPVLFHPTVGAGSVGLEVGFFVSQGCIVASACFWRRLLCGDLLCVASFLLSARFSPRF